MCVCVCVCVCARACVRVCVCLSTGFVPVGDQLQTGGAMAWRFGRLTGMTMQSKALAWQFDGSIWIARNDHAKSWRGGVFAVRKPGLTPQSLHLAKVRVKSALPLFFSKGPARAPREAPCFCPGT